MSLATGDKLGDCEIISSLGVGGMGEVYLARDVKLDRQVAIKVLPEVMTRDQERVARFEREAKLLASLNHPNIAATKGTFYFFFSNRVAPVDEVVTNPSHRGSRRSRHAHHSATHAATRQQK